MTTCDSQVREVERYLDAAEKIGVPIQEAVRRLLKSERGLWSDLQKIYAWGCAQ